jgi:hypothetical protein
MPDWWMGLGTSVGIVRGEQVLGPWTLYTERGGAGGGQIRSCHDSGLTLDLSISILTSVPAPQIDEKRLSVVAVQIALAHVGAMAARTRLTLKSHGSECAVRSTGAWAARLGPRSGAGSRVPAQQQPPPSAACSLFRSTAVTCQERTPKTMSV